MLARLSSSDYRALTGLKTREDDDFTIAFLDASSVILDILTFYQERLANEAYLRTTRELRSLVELSRLIGYEPAPGVAASAYVAFTLKTTPGQVPDPSTPPIAIPRGTQVQSVAAQGQKPQTFETSADILAKPDWNALPVQRTQVWSPQLGHTSVYLQGIATQLQPGDFVLIVGDERLGDKNKNNWDVRIVTTVQADTLNNRTLVAWDEPLGCDGDHPTEPAKIHARVYALRQRAALFGYNAINPLMLTKDAEGRLQGSTPPLVKNDDEWDFAIRGLDASSLIDLDAIYPKLISPGWVALVKPDKQTTRTPSGCLKLYYIKSIAVVSRSDFAISAKITRLETDTNEFLADYHAATRKTVALVQSEELAVPEQPLSYPLYGSEIRLRDLRPDLVQVAVVAVLGKRQKLRIKAGTGVLQFAPDADPASKMQLNPGDILTLTDPTPLCNVTRDRWTDSEADPVTLNVEDASGRPGTVSAPLASFDLAPSGKTDPEVSECALVSSISTDDGPPPHTCIALQSSLLNCYERDTTKVNANVALATHGQSVTEIIGSGSASIPNQNFALKQSPVTYVQAPTPNGRQSTLEVEVSGVKWKQVSSLYQKDASERVFTILNQSDATTEIIFGDGVEGARLPTGQNNLRANYRISSGSAGNVGSKALTTLMDRPLGVGGVTNPQSATGGQDAESPDDIRHNAPQTVVTLGRAVSISDYQTYAATFAGIAKAHAIWIPSGPARGIFLTVAGVSGAALPPDNPTLVNLVTSLHNYGNPLIPITAVSFLETLFSLSADLQYDSAYDQPTVKSQVLETLSQTYSFGHRTFGQGVSADEVATVIQGIPGVIAVNVTGFQIVATSSAGDLASQGGAFTITKLNNWLAQKLASLPRPDSGSPPRICPYLPIPILTSLPQPAEILVLHPDPAKVTLGVMS